MVRATPKISFANHYLTEQIERASKNLYGNGISMTQVFYTAIGETGKASAYISSEKEMEKVVRIKQ